MTDLFVYVPHGYPTCPVMYRDARYVTGCPVASPAVRMHNSKSTITGYTVTQPGKLEAVPLRNRARSRLSRCPTGQYEAVPLRNGA